MIFILDKNKIQFWLVYIIQSVNANKLVVVGVHYYVYDVVGMVKPISTGNQFWRRRLKEGKKFKERNMMNT